MGKTVETSLNTVAEERKLKFKQFFNMIVSFLGLVVLVLFFGIVTKGQLVTSKNLMLIFKQSFALLLASLAAVFIMSTGNLDFSLGANIGFCCSICTILCKSISPAAGILAALAIGALIGAINGLAITKLKLPSFIACLCTMFILTAATQTICSSKGGSISMPLSMRKWNEVKIFVVVGVLYVAAMIVLFRYMRFGKYMKAIGVSPEAARQSGVNVDLMIVLGYMLTGLAAGLAAFLLMLRTGGVSSTTGQTMTTDVIIAIVFGGMSVAGGASSKISAAILGTLIVTTLNNGMVLAGYGGEWQQFVKGILFLVIISVSTKRDSNTIIK